jgi:hypothetical protein
VAVAHPPVRDDMIRKGPHIDAPAFERGHFWATVLIEVNVQRCLGKAVMRMEVLREALGQLARRMVVDIAYGFLRLHRPAPDAGVYAKARR